MRSQANNCQVKPQILGTPPTPTPATLGPCGVGQFRCDADKTCISRTRLCDFRSDCSDDADENQCGSTCDFEDGLCGWTNSERVRKTPNGLDKP